MSKPPVSDEPPRLGGYIQELRRRIAELEGKRPLLDQRKLREAAIDATIERCALVADERAAIWRTKANEDLQNPGCALSLMAEGKHIAYNIRALKDKP